MKRPQDSRMAAVFRATEWTDAEEESCISDDLFPLLLNWKFTIITKRSSPHSPNSPCIYKVTEIFGKVHSVVMPSKSRCVTLHHLIKLFEHRRPFALIRKLARRHFHQSNSQAPNVTSHVVAFVGELGVDALWRHVWSTTGVFCFCNGIWEKMFIKNFSRMFFFSSHLSTDRWCRNHTI